VDLMDFTKVIFLLLSPPLFLPGHSFHHGDGTCLSFPPFRRTLASGAGFIPLILTFYPRHCCDWPATGLSPSFPTHTFCPLIPVGQRTSIGFFFVSFFATRVFFF